MNLVESLSGLPGPMVLMIVAVLLAAESGLIVGVVLPGATVPLGLGLLSRFGTVDFTAAVLTVAGATLVGSQLSFLRARGRDPRVFRLLRRAEPLLKRAKALLNRHPGTGMAAGRLVGGVRTVVPVVAARAGVPHRRFLACDVPAALVWSGVLVTLGHVAGAAYDEVRLGVGLVGPPVVFVVLVVYLGRKLVRNRYSSTSLRSPDQRVWKVPGWSTRR
jgi:membrane-associated protein